MKAVKENNKVIQVKSFGATMGLMTLTNMMSVTLEAS